MFGTFAIVILAVAMVPALAIVPTTKGVQLIDGNYYFSDNTATRTRAQALAYCASFDAELAKVSGRSYRLLTLGLPAVGSYWIDGVDKANGDRFSVSKECTGDGSVDFTGIPRQNVDIPTTICLSIVKGTSGAATKIQGVGCNGSLRGVICSYPANGCDVPVETTTV